jgi:hypothetical protein
MFVFISNPSIEKLFTIMEKRFRKGPQWRFNFLVFGGNLNSRFEFPRPKTGIVFSILSPGYSRKLSGLPGVINI